MGRAGERLAPVAVLPVASWIQRDLSGLTASATASAVVVGDPDFGGLAPQLPGARGEASKVAGLYSRQALIGPAATEGALRAQIGQELDILHLATHALYDPKHPLQSVRRLPDGSKAAPLTAEHIFQRPLRAKLVVLSACEFGMGRVVAGDDTLGLARSFYLSGAKAIVSSLWEVEDEPTRLFMETFHAELRKGGVGRAWLAARDRLKSAGHAPASYAPFIVSGSI